MYSAFFRIIICLIVCSIYFTVPVFAKNMIQNPVFSKTIVTDDIWDGVDKDGNLHVNSRNLPIMIEGSHQQDKSFGASPCWKDVTGDGKPDLVVGDGDGRFIERDAFPNYSSVNRNNLRTRKQVDLSRSYPLIMMGDLPLCFGSYAAPRLVDWTRNKKNDLVVGEGSYSANSIYLFRNQGQNSNPDFIAAKRHWLA